MTVLIVGAGIIGTTIDWCIAREIAGGERAALPAPYSFERFRRVA